MGRSAVDAVELMHAATERMREHTPVTQRSHWVTLEGGEAPNVVPERASTWYFIRDIDDNLENRLSWVMDCAKGAALMTQTAYEVKVLAAAHQQHSNKALAELIFENIKVIGKPEYTEEEEAFARAIQKNIGVSVKGLDYPLELVDAEVAYYGVSSDVGDVTLVAPCATINFPTLVSDKLHHWSVVASGNSSIAHKGITAGAKVACCTVYDLLTKSDRLVRIRNEFEELAKKHPYKIFLPDDAKPPLGWNTSLMSKYRGEMEQFYINT